ncbi:MAG: RIP metalloprotease RseP [Acidobacteria bacterium]|nr:RIP metalloprotease RseP [Acidobacteriota bacterium]
MLTNVATFIFVLGVLIFVHELGHYLMAKKIGVRVLTFSLGFGPKILRYRKGETEYCVSAVPLGGYVKMAGDNPEEARTGRDDEFLSKSKWQRFQVMIMGPAMNIVLALVVMTIVLYQGAEVPAYEQQAPVVSTVLSGSPAARGGIKPGDRIVSVAGRPVETWEQFFMAVAPRAKRDTAIVVRRDGRERSLRVTPSAQSTFEMGDIGVIPDVHPQVRVVTPRQPAERAGIRPGDVILDVNGAPVGRDRPLVQTINQNAGVPLTLGILRDDKRIQIVVTPAKQGNIGLIGVQLSEYELRTIEPGPVQAVTMSLEKNWEWSTLIFQTLWGLLTRETSPKQLMGPVAIAQLTGGAAQVGLLALFSLMAMISLNLGILNLLPIPVLDGGHIFIMALEGIARRDFSIRVKEKILLAGFVVLMMLMVTVIYNDLTRIQWIENLMPWR